MAVLRKLSRGRGQRDELDVFVSQRNIARYRRLLDQRTNADQRQTIIGLLRAEMAKLRGPSIGPDLPGSVSDGHHAP